MLRMSQHLAVTVILTSGFLTGCHGKQTASGPVAVRLQDGTTQVIPAGKPIPVGATVIATTSGSQPLPPGMTASSNAPQSVAPATTAADAPVGPNVTASAPVASSPAPSPSAAVATAAPAPELVVPAGTHVSVRTTETLSAEHSGGVGTAFTGVLNAPVIIHGTSVFARGTPVRGEISSAKGRGRFKGAGDLGVTLTEIGGYHVQTSEYVASAKGRGKRTAGFIGGGGGVGALIGGLAGGGKGALIGGLAGAGAGTAAGGLTGGRDVVIPSESAVGFTLEGAIHVKKK